MKTEIKFFLIFSAMISSTSLIAEDAVNFLGKWQGSLTTNGVPAPTDWNLKICQGYDAPDSLELFMKPEDFPTYKGPIEAKLSDNVISFKTPASPVPMLVSLTSGANGKTLKGLGIIPKNEQNPKDVVIEFSFNKESSAACEE